MRIAAPERRLSAHLRSWLGHWPPRAGWEVIGSTRRTQPGWDGRIHSVLGVRRPGSGSGAAVLSVPPAAQLPVTALLRRGGVEALPASVAIAVGVPDQTWFEAVFRWCARPADLPDAGVWRRAEDDGVPDWLRPFGGDVLVAAAPDGTHLAGVGIKRHDEHGHELAVVTTEAAQGRGLARRLVAQAARRVLADGAVPTYLHLAGNLASARVADAAGFPDRGWTAFGLSNEPPPA